MRNWTPMRTTILAAAALLIAACQTTGDSMSNGSGGKIGEIMDTYANCVVDKYAEAVEQGVEDITDVSLFAGCTDQEASLVALLQGYDASADTIATHVTDLKVYSLQVLEEALTEVTKTASK